MRHLFVFIHHFLLKAKRNVWWSQLSKQIKCFMHYLCCSYILILNDRSNAVSVACKYHENIVSNKSFTIDLCETPNKISEILRLHSSIFTFVSCHVDNKSQVLYQIHRHDAVLSTVYRIYTQKLLVDQPLVPKILLFHLSAIFITHCYKLFKL